MNKRIFLILGVGLILGAAIYLFLTPKQQEGGKRPVRRNPPQANQQSMMKVTIYYPNPEYVKTSNDKVSRVIPIQRSMKKAQGEALAQSVMGALTVSPMGGETALKRIKVLGTQVKNEIAYVNFSSQKLYGGSLEETLLIEQVVRTLTGLPGIKKVQFLVDGEPAETLMGHFGVESPLSVSDL